MNWDEVYENMKLMLDCLGIPWKHKHHVEVHIDGDNLVFTHGNDTFSFKVNRKPKGGDAP